MSSTDKTSLGDRMKMYEGASRTVLSPRTPVILRVDGKAFHTFTRGADKPFDMELTQLMNDTAIALCKQVQGAQIAYVQSDEISVLIHGYKSFNSSPWFDNQVQKMVSIGAAIATATFNVGLFSTKEDVKAGAPALRTKFTPPAMFDARVFTVPEDEVCNYFLWRQQDCSRNSVQMLARSLYSHKECENKNGSQLQEMCHAKGSNWNDVKTQHRRGRCVVKETFNVEGTARSRWVVDNEIPIFSENREYVTSHLAREE